MRKMLKKIFLIVLMLLALTAIWHADLLLYAARQGAGQFLLIWNARPVKEVVADPSVPDSVKQKLMLVDEIRQFAINSLGLKDTRSYRKLYDQQGREVLWVVTACKPFELVEKRWRFPIVGEVPYKGFFNPAHAEAEKHKLEAEGWDVSVRNPGGWSTLGWFEDPLLSSMLFRSEGDLASLIIHEMVHATLYVKDSADLNENLASFIGDRGAEFFLNWKYGKHSDELRQYREEDMEYRKLSDHMLRGYDLLDSLYKGMEGFSDEQKVTLKRKVIRNIISATDTLKLKWLRSPAKTYSDSLPNNTYFMNFKRYQSRQDNFEKEWQSRFRGDLQLYITYLKEKYPSP
ncbi:MAG: aminopeptidase [Cyclobacteriaceae bacterium]|nr:aminopeptidase [Cyclobacteriaceae bacterium]MCX7636885.1 aminopeptidase [Cyclobacteriaceae bacterium]MDW8330229.1 aminopeptidase [Cyclobacteriaceae bacterium]